ncbi:hypothetical protein CYL18_15125 [Pradoshia eiseniae]|uniref:Uncharacterized protein n=1 Tax=Pradoshia eiseniae TaxID=2064768 RepID=A0A2S7MX78_9BACI|nr:hypothetical protein [Pradoshia eiseniae]PQD94360.1 hypothetical protein CYL18_15125 [Pradoshia eiseniae]
MAKVKHFIKEGKIIRETKIGKNIEQEEVTQEEFERHESRKSANGCIWNTFIFIISMIFIYIVISQI